MAFQIRRRFTEYCKNCLGTETRFYRWLRFTDTEKVCANRISVGFSHLVTHIEYSQAVDFTERALFTYERGFVGAFNFTGGMNRLDFDRVENRPFFLALHRQTT